MATPDKHWKILGWMLLLWVMAAGPGYAQQDRVSPHGKFTIDIDCKACHVTDAWKPIREHPDFNHSRQTKFALLGKHAQVSCQSCHLDLKFSEPDIAQDDCQSCHADVHQGRLGTDCESCHNEQTFQLVDGRMIHNQTSFPLTGAHRQISCESCHTTQRAGAFTALDTDCYSCHKDDYENARSVDHVANNFPITCENCHGTTGWSGAPFDHESVSGGFRLLGAHSRITCQGCHVVPSMELKFHPTSDTDCFSCHEADYTRQHGGSGFPTTCLSCHNTDSWEGAEFDHERASGGFTLLGAHSKTECTSCHVVPSYDTKFDVSSQDDCVGCHQADYDRAHAGSGFPTTCQTCHNNDNWGDADFEDHDAQFFPIYSGPHQNTWESCQTCHTTSGNFADFSCLTCHQHNQTDTDAHHSEVGGYTYESTACYSCHPDGRNEGGG